MKLLLAAVVSLMLAGSAGAAAPAKPSLHVTPGATSIMVAGQGFRAGEKVVVLVFHSGVRVSRHVAASPKGVFRLRVTVGAVDECTFGYVSAKGDRGSRATYRQVPPPCGPPIAP